MRLSFQRIILTVGCVVGLGMAPAQAQFSDVQVGTLVDALNQANTTPNGTPLPLNDWQTDNVGRWAQQCIGRSLTPEQFTTSPVTARWISICTLREILKAEYETNGKNEAIALRRASAWWVTGNPNRYNQGETAAYTQKVLSLYRQKNPTPAKVATTPAPNPKPSPTPTIAPATNAPTGDPAPMPPPIGNQTPPAPIAITANTPFYDRYMQAGYEATNRRDYQTGLLYFKRALDERPDDSYAAQAIKNVEGYLKQPAPPPKTTTAPSVIVPPVGNSPPKATTSTPTPAPTTSTPTKPTTSKPATNTVVSNPTTAKPTTPTKLTPPKTVPTAQPAPASGTSPTATIVIPAAPTSDAFNQQQAIVLINRWLQAKPEVFAPPFDQQLIANLTTGELLASLLRPNGVLTWLKTNGAYFRYGVQNVDSVERFVVARDRATIEVNLTEDRTLYLNGAIDPTRTDFSSQRVRFTFRLENGTWKIADYKTADGSLLERSVLEATRPKF